MEPHCPLDAISSDTQPLIILATSYDIFQPYLVPLNWLPCLGSERSRYIPDASKAARPMCSTGDQHIGLAGQIWSYRCLVKVDRPASKTVRTYLFSTYNERIQ